MAGIEGHQALALGCGQTKRDLVAIGISGGGAKASTFGGETLFYLEAIGLLSSVDLISSVSGGSLAAAYYALSCDPKPDGDPKPDDCAAALPAGRKRAAWAYADTMRTLESGFKPVLGQAVVNFLIPGKRTPVSPEEFTAYYEKNYFHGEDANGTGAPFLYRDLNPRRPLLVLNSTLLSGGRLLAESTRGAGFLRRRTADEFFHFAFTDYYFDRLGADLGTLPVAFAATASGAFPTLVDNPKLKDYRLCRGVTDRQACLDGQGTLRLTDGGANDNQGLVEIYAVMAELAEGERRSDLSGPRGATAAAPGPALQLLRAGDHALFLVVNSSITEATGFDPPPEGFLTGVIDRSSAAVDVYSAVGFNLRKQLYEAKLNGLAARHKDQRYTAAEIGLVTLNHYEAGGLEIATADEAGVVDAETHGNAKRAALQSSVFARLRDPAIRGALGLTAVHPQCLFEQSKLAETGITSLANLSDQNKSCIRHAARWATALRAEEFCRDGSVLADPTALHCTADHHLAPLSATTIAEFKALKDCDLDADSPEQRRAIRTSLEDDFTFRVDLSRRNGKRDVLADTASRAVPLSLICNLDWTGDSPPAVGR